MGGVLVTTSRPNTILHVPDQCRRQPRVGVSFPAWDQRIRLGGEHELTGTVCRVSNYPTSGSFVL